MEKKKTRFFLIIGVLVVIVITSWMFMARGMKETFRVLGNDTPEVKSQINVIKDYRKLKGYKILQDEKEYKMIMISAGLTYGREDKIEVASVDFGSNEVMITVKEDINPNPEKEVVNYPFVIIKLDTSKDSIKVVNTMGEDYIPINLDNPIDEKLENDKLKEENKLEEDKKTEEEKLEEEKKPEEEQKEEIKPSEKQVKVEYQGRIDDESIEVKIGNDYTTFYLGSSVKTKINNYSTGDSIVLTYTEENGQKRVIAIN